MPPSGNGAPAANTGLYEFNFEDINVEDLEMQPMEAMPADPTGDAGEAGPTKEEIRQEEKRIEKLEGVRARRKGLKASVGFLTWVKDLAIIGIIVWLILLFAGFYTVQDKNMDPTLVEGEHILVFKYSYKLASPARGELVAIKNRAVDGASEEDNGVFFARVIGLPGDRIDIRSNGAIYVNEKLLVTKYCNGTTGFVYGELSYPYTVPEGSYFVLSDNPASTMDSRYSGVRAVALEDIDGKVLLCFWPRQAWRPIH